MSNGNKWANRVHRGARIIKRKRQGSLEYQLLETYDQTGRDPALHYFVGIFRTPNIAIGDPRDLGDNREKAERLFDQEVEAE